MSVSCYYNTGMADLVIFVLSITHLDDTVVTTECIVTCVD